ncbi:MAG: hypothetical protein Q8M20_18195 [Rhodocyclaceae bacterium]|nr:hypothetical protein [Rhodocyclaceae bacterium]
MIKRVYLYDDKNLFTNHYDACVSPEQPGVYITPDNSLETEPNFVAGMWPVAVNGAWVNQLDHRGIVWETATGNQVEHDQLGALPVGLISIPKPDGFYCWVDGAWVFDISASRAAMSCTSGQFRIALTQLGLRAIVEQAILTANQDTKDMWEYFTTYRRLHPAVIGIATALGKTDVEVDAIFELAVTIS